MISESCSLTFSFPLTDCLAFFGLGATSGEPAARVDDVLFAAASDEVDD
jgi:hypothetical protein